MVINGFLGKKELQLNATVYRPPGSGLFPLVVLNRDGSPNAFDRPKTGRTRSCGSLMAGIGLE
jgi:hypothetical protein